MPKYPCGICSAAMKQRDPAVCCDQCGMWIHNICSGLSAPTYELMKNSSGVWICPSCGLPSFSSSLFNSSTVTSISNSFSVLDAVDNNLPHFIPACSSSPIKSKQQPANHDRIKVLSINVNSLRGKAQQLEELIFYEEPDIVLCQETKIDSSVSNNELFPSSFTIFRKDRTLHGGGVCIAVKNHLQAVQCHELDCELEAIWIQLQTSDHQLIYLCSIYHPPDKDVDYTELLRSPLEELAMKHRDKPPIIIIAEDLNFPLIKWELNSAPSDADGRNLLNLLDDFYLQQLVTGPLCTNYLIVTRLGHLITPNYHHGLCCWP